MFWALLLLIFLVVYFTTRAIIKISLKKILSKYFNKLEFISGSTLFSIEKMIGENDLFDIEIRNLQLSFSILALFDLVPKSPFPKCFIIHVK